MRRIILCLAFSSTLIGLLVASCGPTVKVEAPEEPIRVEAKIEPIKIEAKVELHIYQHAVQDVSYITGTAPPKTTAPETPTEKKTEEETSPPAERKESKAGDVFLRILGIGAAHAEGISDEQQVKRLLDSMHKRYGAVLRNYKAEKSVGENRNGYLEERPSPKMSDPKYAQAVRATVAGANADRRLLYRIRARMTGTTPEKVGVIYAKAWQDSARPGEWIEVLVNKRWVWKQK